MNRAPGSAFKGSKRERILVWILGVAALGVGSQLAYVMLVEHGQLARRARAQQIEEERLPAVRGNIFDRHMNLMVTHGLGQSLYAMPAAIADPEVLAGRLAEILDRDAEEMRRLLSLDSKFIRLARRIDNVRVAKIQELGRPNRQLRFLPEPIRVYPMGPVAAHLLGFTNVDGQGLENLELRYDAFLRGQPGVRRYERDRHGHTRLLDQREFPGNSLVLHLGSGLQGALERELDGVVGETGAEAAMILVMDVEGGGLLASAVRPGFAPDHRLDSATWRHRPITDALEPGNALASLFIQAAALEEGIIETPGRLDAATGSREILACLGKKRFHALLRQFGFGEKTGVDLPGEATGLTREPGTEPPAALGPGYLLTATPIQILAAFSAIANRGTLMEPRAVAKIVAPSGEVIRDFPSRSRGQAISEKTADLLMAAFFEADRSEDGQGQGQPMIWSAARYDAKTRGYPAGQVRYFALGLVGREQKAGVILVVDRPVAVAGAEKATARAMAAITGHVREALDKDAG